MTSSGKDYPLVWTVLTSNTVRVMGLSRRRRDVSLYTTQSIYQVLIRDDTPTTPSLFVNVPTPTYLILTHHLDLESNVETILSYFWWNDRSYHEHSYFT